MTPESVMVIFQQALEVILVLVLIILLPALAVGLTVSMFQAATQINEMTLSFIPKLLITLFTLMVAGSFMLNMMVEYTQNLIREIPFLIG